ncbi:MAG: sigma-70 family RNA polymerase sigma factor [Myxococcota bacterium]|nr:sigma-70 family RNA polymerase sigma factor [Myxococcota bacterium]
MNQHAQWVEAVALRQDRHAFISLFEHFAPRLKGFLISGGAELEQVDEIVQEVMLVVWRRAGSYRSDRAAVSTWIFTIARNRRIDRIRRTRRPALDPADTILQPTQAPAPDDASAQQRRAEQLRSALESLPVEQATVIRRAWLEGIPQAQVAAELGLPIGTVKSRLRLAMSRLRAVLEGSSQ